MFSYLLDIAIVLTMLFCGIKYLKTREYEDKKDIYTDESKEKAALISGVVCLLAAVSVGVLAILRFRGILSSNFDDGFTCYYILFGAVVFVIIVVFISIYAAVLKKK